MRDRTDHREFLPPQKSRSRSCQRARHAHLSARQTSLSRHQRGWFADSAWRREDAAAKPSMSKTISAAVYETHGNPADVLRIESQPWPKPGPEQAVVKMRAAPINPAD